MTRVLTRRCANIPWNRGGYLHFSWSHKRLGEGRWRCERPWYYTLPDARSSRQMARLPNVHIIQCQLNKRIHIYVPFTIMYYIHIARLTIKIYRLIVPRNCNLGYLGKPNFLYYISFAYDNRCSFDGWPNLTCWPQFIKHSLDLVSWELIYCKFEYFILYDERNTFYSISIFHVI